MHDGVAQPACAFRRIRPPIPITSGHLFRCIRPPVTRCREAVDFGYQFWGFSSSFLAMVFSHGRTVELYAVRVVNDAVEDGVCEGGLTDNVMPG